MIGAVVAVLLLTTASVAAVVEQTPDICGRNESRTNVFAEFDVATASELVRHFPDFTSTPGLSEGAGPLHVVAFTGKHYGVPLLGGPHTRPASAGIDNVVCVVKPDGDTIYYTDVSYQDFRP